MADGITMRFKNGREFLAKMDRKVKRLANTTRPMAKVMAGIRDSILDGTINKQVETMDVGQGRFKALNRKYAAKKARKFGSKPILVTSGEMLKIAHFIIRVVKKGAGQVVGTLTYRASKKVMTRALTHQKPITWKGPRRKWYGFRRGDQAMIRKELGNHVKISVRA